MHKFDFYGRLSEANDLLQRYAYYLTDDTSYIDDIVQDTILKAIDNKEKFRRDNNFNGWLSSIMHNTYSNTITHEQRYVNITAYDCYEQEYHDSFFEYKELLGIVATLPSHLCTPFEMYASGYKYCEIAEIMHIPIGTVKTRIHLARKALKKVLEKEYGYTR